MVTARKNCFYINGFMILRIEIKVNALCTVPSIADRHDDIRGISLKNI
jgi:hypothetical protein